MKFLYVSNIFKINKVFRKYLLKSVYLRKRKFRSRELFYLTRNKEKTGMSRNDYTCIGLSYTVPVLETQQGVHGEAKNHKHTVIL